MITSFAAVYRNGGVKDSAEQALANSNLVLHQAGSCHEEVGQSGDATCEVRFFFYNSWPLYLVHLFQLAVNTVVRLFRLVAFPWSNHYNLD